MSWNRTRWRVSARKNGMIKKEFILVLCLLIVELETNDSLVK